MGEASSACVKFYGGTCEQNSSSTVTTIFGAGASQNTAAAAACAEMLALLWPLLASASAPVPGISYSSPVMEWPCNDNPVCDAYCPCVLVPSHLEAEQKQLEPLQRSGVGRAEEVETGAVWTRVPVKFY